MAKFRMRLKIQGFELEVDGEREDIPAITSAIQQQFKGLVQPAELMIDDSKQLAGGATTIEGETGKPASRFGQEAHEYRESLCHRWGNTSDRVSTRPRYLRQPVAIMVSYRQIDLDTGRHQGHYKNC